MKIYHSAQSLLLFVGVLFYVGQCNVEDSRFLIEFSSGSKYGNMTSNLVTKQMLDSFVAIVNFAANTYAEDIKKMVRYIKLRMDSLYGTPKYNFFINIQTDDSISTSCIWISSKAAIYGYLYGIDRVHANWSYFFTRNEGSNIISEYAFMQNGSMGAGFRPWLFDLFSQYVYANEEGDYCQCDRQDLALIIYGMFTETYWLWNIICDDQGDTLALAQAYEEQWISTKIKNCYYTLYI